MKFSHLSILALFLAYGCFNNNAEIVTEPGLAVKSFNIDQTIIDSLSIELSELASDLAIIKLKSDSSIFLGSIQQVIKTGDFYIIESGEEVFQFDMNGNFVRKPFVLGRGPEEFLMPYYASISYNNNQLIYDGAKSKGVFYGIDLVTGAREDIKRVSSARPHCFGQLDDSTIIVYTDSNVGSNNLQLLTTLSIQNKKGNIIKEWDMGQSYLPNVVPPAKMLFISGETYVQTPRCEMILRVNRNMIDTVWINYFETNIETSLKTGDYSDADLVYFSKEMVLLLKKTIRVKGRVTFFNQNNELIMVDRQTGQAKIIKLYLQSKINKIEIGRAHV